jgi:hypothetical protein
VRDPIISIWSRALSFGIWKLHQCKGKIQYC